MFAQKIATLAITSLLAVKFPKLSPIATARLTNFFPRNDVKRRRNNWTPTSLLLTFSTSSTICRNLSQLFSKPLTLSSPRLKPENGGGLKTATIIQNTNIVKNLTISRAFHCSQKVHTLFIISPVDLVYYHQGKECRHTLLPQ